MSNFIALVEMKIDEDNQSIASKSMSLVVSQTHHGHDDVLTLLRALRAARQAASQ